MSYLSAIQRTRIEILSDNERPRDILISVALRYPLLADLNPMGEYRSNGEYDSLLGMKIEWTKSKPLTQPQVSIRTDKGDLRVVRFDGDKEP